MKRVSRFLVAAFMLLFVLAATSAFAVVPSPLYDVSTSIDTTANTMTWSLTNLTDDASGFKLVRVDWLYPIYDVNNVAPQSPWVFAKYQLAPDERSGNISTAAVSWMTTPANGLAYGDSMDFTILSGPLVVDQEPFPLHLMWQRLAADTPPGEPMSMDIGTVPEPGSFLALFYGLCATGAAAWKRRRG